MNCTVRNGKRVSAFVGWTTLDSRPVVLSICQVFRSEVLKVYALAFRSYHRQAVVYIDLSSCQTGGLDLADKDASFERRQSARYACLGSGNSTPGLFLGSGFHGADDAENVYYLALGVNDGLYEKRTSVGMGSDSSRRSRI